MEWSVRQDYIAAQRTGGTVVADSAFAGVNTQSIIKSHQHNINRQGAAKQKHELNAQATSVRQLSEWGMRALQGSFPRLKDRFIYEEVGTRKLALQMIVLLYNFRAGIVGQNQIASVFMPHLEKRANSYSTA